MNIPAHAFREYDIRGITGTDLTPEFAWELGRAIGTHIRRGNGSTVVVGRDCRQSGVELGEALREGLRSSGCDTIDIGIVPTPVAYWAIQHLDADGSVQITGSHNPPDYNGFKLTLLGKSLHGDDIRALRTAIENQDYESGGGTDAHQDVLPEYLDDAFSRLKPGGRKLRLVVDAGNGTGGLTAVPLFERMGHEVIPLYCELDGSFPNHHADPTVEENLADLKQAIREHEADLGFAFDGDADRLGVIDRDGTVVWGDMLMILLSRALLADVPGATIIGEVKCSKTLYDDIAKRGGTPVMWKAGHSLIKAKMKETRAELAGEMSGHIFYKHRYYGFDDAVYAGGRLLEILAATQESVGELLADVPKMYSTAEIRVECPEDRKFEVVDAVRKIYEQRDGLARVVAIDGVRAEWDDGWGLVRASNTTPLLILRFEALSEVRCSEIRADFELAIDEVRKELGV